MAVSILHKLLKPKGSLFPTLTEVLRPYGDSMAVFDTAGQLLFGCADLPSGEQRPIASGEQALGWVQVRDGSPADAAALARFFSFLAAQEADKKALTGELIDRYRELSLLYHLSERLAAAPQPESIARLAIEETLRTIPAAAALILLKQPGGGYRQAAQEGRPDFWIAAHGLVERVLATERAELANNVPGAEYFQDLPGAPAGDHEERSISLLCAPLKTEQQVLGAIALIDHGEREFSAGDLKLLNTIAMQAAPAIEISRLYQVALEKARIERELQVARQVQESLLPARMPELPGWTFAVRWRPAREVSGDFYDVIDESTGGPGEKNTGKPVQRLGLIIADATDKGMPASLFSVFVRTALRASIRRSNDPAEAITYANQLVCNDSHEGLFATLVYAQLMVETCEVRYVNAGHNPPLFYHARSGELRLLSRTGLLLGAIDNAQYRFQAVSLDPGDFILFYTDGLTEATGPTGDEFGLDRLKQVTHALQEREPELILNGIEEELSRFTGSTVAQDDITLMVMKRIADRGILQADAPDIA